MSVLFTAFFNEHPITVLQIRGRPAFLAHELGVAAGYADDGQRFVDQIVREWAASLDEDDDIAQVVGNELGVLKREVPLPPTTTTALVLFPTGAERCLVRSHARAARKLVCFLHDEVLSRVIAFNHANTQARGGTDDRSPPPAAPPIRRSTTLQDVMRGAPPPAKSPMKEAAEKLNAAVKRLNAIDRRKEHYREMIRLAETLRADGLITMDQWAALRVEAVEELLGRPLRACLPPFGLDTAQPPFAA